ncbi:uncharacterized protein LOC107041909 [Diachasma alloeum]|uniref:uncharacterized protein LOC107041909 n=1 Tax=Diachasma alloeum TaxID=454923 RepID=UPI0007384F79|nr:uncharacterized protein LOC107041909 [Diachasma alloeum]
MLDDMEFERCQTYRRNESDDATGTNCTSVKSGSDIQLTALDGKLDWAGERCNVVKNCLDYYAMLYQSAGPTSMDMTMEIPYVVSPRSSQVDSPRIPIIPMIEEIRFIEKIGANEANENEQIEKDFPDSPKPPKLASTIALELNKSSVQLIPNTWSEKSLRHVFSISNNQFFDPSNPEIIETLPREPEIVLKLTERREKSARDEVLKPRELYSVVQSKKPVSSRQDESPHRLMKKKRRKMKLKRSNSKSTTASKHVANLSETRHVRRVKRRVHKVEEPQPLPNDSHEKPQSPRKKLMNKNEQEVVEIYHNAAVQSVQSISEASVKQQLKIPPERPLKDASKNIKNRINQTKASELKAKPILIVKNQEEKAPVANDQAAIIRKREGELRVKDPPEEFHPQPVRTWYNSYGQPNYQQPTFSSRLKCVNRCYLTARFNLRNIPFVVGTSITPSHNIGLNIQQVLSLMKSKQPGLATEMRPFFIKKMGKELHPFDFTVENEAEDSSGREHVEGAGKTGLKEVPGGGDSLMQMKSNNLQADVKHVESRLPRCSGITSNSSEIRNVLMRLHYKFEEMQTKYEKLQEQSTKSKDAALHKELRELEDELNAKESEISAVVGLYNEVMALKSQIHGAYHQKNSLLCMAEDYSERISQRFYPNYQRPRTSSCGVKTPSTSTRLTGLLRQIQSFQQQLISS